MPGVHFQAKVLRRIQRVDEYKVYRAALEWDLEDSIVIDKRADFKSELRWKDRLEPYHHQVTNLLTFCRRLPVTLIADDVGLGKTISAGLVSSELVARYRISRILVVSPKLLGLQWKESSIRINIIYFATESKGGRSATRLEIFAALLGACFAIKHRSSRISEFL